MPSAIELIREQRAAVAEVHRQLLGVADLLAGLRRQAAALATDQDLRAVLKEEQAWLAEAQRLVSELRHLRESEDYRWLPRLRRSFVALAFALVSAAAAGLGYGVAHRQQLEASLRSRAAFADAIQERLEGMTEAERRLFDSLFDSRSPRTR